MSLAAYSGVSLGGCPRISWTAQIDEFVKSQKTPLSAIPANAGIQLYQMVLA